MKNTEFTLSQCNGFIKKSLFIRLLGVFLLLCCGVPNALAQKDVEGREVLVLHSYHPGLKWTDDINEAVTRRLALSGKPIHIQVEYLDAKRYGSNPFEEQAASLLEKKLAQRNFDLVLVSDDDAFQFALNHRNGLFCDLPIVFCGVNRYRFSAIDGQGAITGVIESPAFAETVGLALRLHPGTREIVVINRQTTLTGQTTRTFLNEALSRFDGPVRISFWSDLPWDALQSRLAALGPGQLVLLTDVIADAQHGVLSFAESCRQIRRFCAVPIYGVWDFYLGQGIVGGKLLSGREQGQQAAALALRILNGESADAIPVEERGDGVFMFDDIELRRFAIAPSALPPESVIINQERPVYVVPKALFFKGVILLAGLAAGGLFLLKNVHSRYRAEKALRESEARFRGYFDLNLVGMFTMFPNGRWQEINGHFCDMVKYSREELLQKSWIDLTHPDDLNEEYARFEALCAGEIDCCTRDKRYLCKDGSVIHVEISCRALRNPEGRVVRFASVVMDITERKRAEAALRLDEARLEALLSLNQKTESSVEEMVNFTVASAISLCKSRVGYLAFVNAGQGTLVKHGWARGVLEECKMEKASAGFAIGGAGLWAEAARHKKPIIINDYVQPRLVKKGLPHGHTPIDRFMGVPLLKHGEVVAVIGVGNKAEKYDDADIRQLSLLGQGLVRLLESKRAEQELRESRHKYKQLYGQFQTLLNGIPDPICLLSPNMQIIWGNKGAARHMNLGVGELPGQCCHKVWFGCAERCTDCPVARCFDSGEAEEETVTTPDGRIWGLKAFPLKSAAGEVENVIEMAVDITEKVKLRSEAERSARLASLGELAAGVAHEINNPNGVLMLNANFLADFFAEALPCLPACLENAGIEDLAGLNAAEMKAEIPQMLADMQDSSKRISRIVKDLKQFVQSEAEPVLGPLDLNAVVETAVRLTGNNLKKLASGYEVSLEPKLPRVKGIFQHLEQVVINLIVNACQALGDQKGRVFLSTFIDETQGQCVVEVRDEGVGIDPKVLPHITEPFFSTKRQDGGTGLGLSVSARIVREHHGKLEFFSRPGQGTTVKLALPFANEGTMP